MPETQLAAAVVAHFRSIPGAEVYQEVEYGGRADIVVTLGHVLHVVECKVSFGLDVLRQASEWLPVAHRVSIATPARDRWSEPPAFQKQLVESLDLGWFYVSHDTSYDEEAKRFGPSEWWCREAVQAKLRRSVSRDLRGRLLEGHKDFAAAGNAEGKFWSPWRATCKAMREFVTANPGCTLKAAIDGIDHHYKRDSTARSSLSHWLGAKEIGVEWREVDGKRGLWPTESISGDAPLFTR